MMLAQICSSFLLQINRGRYILPASRGCTAYLYKLKSPPSTHRPEQMSGQRMCFAALHDHASSVKEKNLRTLLQFPIIEVPFLSQIHIAYRLGRSFDQIEFFRGAVVTLALLTDLIKQGTPAQVQQLLTLCIIAPGAYECILNHITFSLNNPQLACKMVVKKSDVVEIRLTDFKYMPQQEASAEFFQSKYPNFVVVWFAANFIYLPNFEETLEEKFCFEPKEGDKVDENGLKSIQTKILKTFAKHLYQYNLHFMRVYADSSCKTPITPWKCSYIWFKGKK